MPAQKYQAGDRVMGRWPGSTLYYEVTVLSFDGKSRHYTVIYKDGTELELKEQDIMSLTNFNSRAPSRSRSRSRSPGRRRSSRSRSPARSSRRSSSRTAAAAASAAIAESASSSRKETKPKEMVEMKDTPLKKSTENNSNNRHEQKEENDAANKVIKPAEADPERTQTRYNLRRRKDDGDSKAAETKAEQETKVFASSAVTLSAPLDFGGKMGAFFLMLFLPFWVLFLLLQVNQKDPSLTNVPPTLPSLDSLWDAQALGFVLLWILFQAFLYLLPVGKLSEGMPLTSGQRLQYRTNGFLAALLSASAIGAAVYFGVDLTYIHSHFLQLATASFLISLLLSVYLYVRSRCAAPELLALGGNSGNVVYDFFKGRELNPRIREFDLKFFFEMRPGLIGWCLINFAMALAEMKQQGLDAPSCPMILVNIFQLLYVMDGLWNEEAILTTMDLMHDGFGFMLAFGDLVWVPFTYSLQAYYLVAHPNPMSVPLLSAIVILKLIGFYIFRKSNSEKNAFRRNPSDPKLSYLKTIPTATGKSLLVSGWWGVVRHPNYLGDLIMALAWSLPCGFGHIIPWHYMIYFMVLLVHRDSRDMQECRRKYGSAWDEYCRTVRYRIVPRVY